MSLVEKPTLVAVLTSNAVYTCAGLISALATGALSLRTQNSATLTEMTLAIYLALRR